MSNVPGDLRAPGPPGVVLGIWVLRASPAAAAEMPLPVASWRGSHPATPTRTPGRGLGGPGPARPGPQAGSLAGQVWPEMLTSVFRARPQGTGPQEAGGYSEPSAEPSATEGKICPRTSQVNGGTSHRCV
jgi:hypothetical protein